MVPSGMAHAAAGRGGDPCDKTGHRLFATALGLVLDELEALLDVLLALLLLEPRADLAARLRRGDDVEPVAARAVVRLVGDDGDDVAVLELVLERHELAVDLGADAVVADALKLLEGDSDKAFLASREELKGDLLVQQGRTDDARAAYEKAKAGLSDEAAVGGLQIKLDDLAKGDA